MMPFNNKGVYVLLLLIFGFNCKSNEGLQLPKSQEVFKLGLDTLWTAPIYDFSNNPILNSNGDILMSKMFGTPSGEIFQLYDGVTGKLKWEWQDYFKPELGFTDQSHALFGDVLVLCGNNNTYALDIITGKTLWRHQMDSMYGDGMIFSDEDGYVYHGFSAENATYKIFRTKYYENNWQLVCSYKDSCDYDRMQSSTICVSKNKMGQKILVSTFYLTYNQNSKNTVRAIVLGYNIDEGRFDWVKDYTNKYPNFWVCQSESVNGKVYVFAVYGDINYLVAINVNDGSIVWENVLPDFGVGMYVYGNYIVPLCNGRNAVTCYNLETGKVFWKRDFSPDALAKMNFEYGGGVVFKNYLIVTHCDYLLGLNLNNGNIVYFKEIALPNGCLQIGVAVNEKRKCFYTQDRNLVICYKLPSEIIY
ncbi:MAG: hypothetical protein CFE21_09760 [Bacteroidetes bacterium B1(2017)]|nr:MAG: hypothetical protein CFE21_09760 [Bacteroidetes bacterium B1(2017)]